MKGIDWKTTMSFEEFCLMEKSVKDLTSLLSAQNMILKGMMEQNHPVFSGLLNHFLILNIAGQESLNRLLKYLNEAMFEFIRGQEGGNA